MKAGELVCISQVKKLKPGKKKNGSPYMEKNRTPPTSPTTELPALMGGPEGRAQETPGTKRSLGNTNHGVAATGQ